MSAFCKCSPDDRDEVKKEISPTHYDGETWVVECGNCWGLISGPY